MNEKLSGKPGAVQSVEITVLRDLNDLCLQGKGGQSSIICPSNVISDMGYDYYIHVRRAIKTQSLKGFALTKENNFGSVTVLDRKVRWMIAYQDKFTGCPSVNPVDTVSTIRILTMIFADEL